MITVLPAATRAALARGVWPGDYRAVRGSLTCEPAAQQPVVEPTGRRLFCQGMHLNVTVAPVTLTVGRSLRAEGARIDITVQPAAFRLVAPVSEAARQLVERAERWRNSSDQDLREHATDLITAACSPQPARKLAADLGLPLNKPRPAQIERDAAIVQMARDPKYAGKEGKPLADAVASDLKRYGAGEWRFEQVCVENPYQSGWRAAAWEILKASPSYWASERKAPWHWRTIFRVFEKNGLVTKLS